MSEVTTTVLVYFAVSPNMFSIEHINKQSITAKLDLLQLEAEEHDIFTLSETWLDTDIINDQISLEGLQPPIRKDQTPNIYGGCDIL